MIALVRAVGLQAFYVHLEEDPQGRIVYHDCAVVFVEGRAFLVDPAYRWFGAPHRRFTVLNDVQVVAHQLLQPSGTEDTVARCRAGVKLHPDLPWCHLQLARAYLAQDQFSDAESALAAADALEPDRWDWHAVRGHLDLKRGRYEEARERFTSALKRNPNHGLAYWGLGVALSELSEAQAARDTLALALLHQLPADVRASAERLLAQLEEQLAQQKAPPRTLLEP
jgi:tetratricopeptide (TPR) repeat protein